MKLALLSMNPQNHSSRRLREAAALRGHTIRAYRTDHFSISVERGHPDLYYYGRRMPQVDAVIPRIGFSITHFGTAVVRQFEQMDVFCANSALGIANARDKLRSLQMLSRHNIGLPPTAFARSKTDVLPAIHRVGGAPVIIKLLEGTQGMGVILADTIEIAAAIVETLQTAKQNVLIQKFVAESKGRDVRAFVVGDRVVAAMRRTARGQEFRSNVHRGAQTERLKLDPEYERTAVQAAQIMGLRIAGVDMLEGEDGPQVMEVNSSPGLEGIEGATGIDVAREIIDYIEEHLLFPELDIRQRLTVSRGYGVCEVPVPPKSELVGTTIESSGLGERDIVVLSLYREGVVVPNPRLNREIKPNDRLLCYGKLETMRALLPPKPRRRRRRSTKPATGATARKTGASASPRAASQATRQAASQTAASQAAESTETPDHGRTS